MSVKKNVEKRLLNNYKNKKVTELLKESEAPFYAACKKTEELEKSYEMTLTLLKRFGLNTLGGEPDATCKVDVAITEEQIQNHPKTARKMISDQEKIIVRIISYLTYLGIDPWDGAPDAEHVVAMRIQELQRTIAQKNGLLKTIHDDLKMRADGDGVINISDFIWQKLRTYGDGE